MRSSNNDKWAKDVTQWCPRQNRRRKGRQHRRWEEEIRKIAGITWGRTTFNGNVWQALGGAFAGTQHNPASKKIQLVILENKLITRVWKIVE